MDMELRKTPNLLLFTILIAISGLNVSCAQPEVKNTNNSRYVDLTNAAESSVNSVVYIKTEFTQKNSVWDDFFGGTIWEHFFGSAPSTYPVQAAGSGVIISQDGYIVTNNHVVEDAAKVTITLNDKREYEGEIIETDPASDLALLKINERKLPYLTFANSDSVRIGEWVLAIGNPMGLNSTVTAGIISAKARQLNTGRNTFSDEVYLQTDAAVNSGNSGGALVNAAGQLVGINTAIASGNGYYTGYSFAIPSNIVSKICYDLQHFGATQQAFLGVSIIELNATTAKELNLPNATGIYVAEIDENGAAAQNGFQVGDVITHINNTPTNNIPDVRGVLKTKSPGDRVKVEIIRNKEKILKNVTLLNNKGTTEKIEKQ